MSKAGSASRVTPCSCFRTGIVQRLSGSLEARAATSGAVRSVVGAGKVGKGRLVDAEVAGAGERSDLEVDAGAVGV
jgi:hypothetical protein